MRYLIPEYNPIFVVSEDGILAIKLNSDFKECPLIETPFLYRTHAKRIRVKEKPSTKIVDFIEMFMLKLRRKKVIPASPKRSVVSN